LSEENRCHHCDQLLPVDAVYCPSCGFKIQDWIKAQSEREEVVQQTSLVGETVNAFMALIRKTPVNVPPSSAVFLERQPRSMLR